MAANARHPSVSEDDDCEDTVEDHEDEETAKSRQQRSRKASKKRPLMKFNVALTKYDVGLYQARTVNPVEYSFRSS